MVAVRLDPSEATLPRVRDRFYLTKDDISENFGIVSLDPAAHLYAILVEEEAAARLEGREAVAGVYANPKIEPFGPPKKS